MKAAYIQKFGGPEVLQVGDLPDPTAGAGQIVVDVAAASINAADWKVRAGEYKQANFPLILGRDFSGTVSALGSGVSDLKVGDEVFGVLETGRDGTYSEKIAIGGAIVGKKPAGLSHVDAAALALTGLTAICAVEEALKLQNGETILIQGGAGGVASFAIQLYKHIGAKVITTASVRPMPPTCADSAPTRVSRLQRDRLHQGGQERRRGVRHGGGRRRLAHLRGAAEARSGRAALHLPRAGRRPSRSAATSRRSGRRCPARAPTWSASPSCIRPAW